MTQLKEVRLHGDLAQKFGCSHLLDIQSPSEAVRAMCVLHDGFEETIREGNYRLFRGDLEPGSSIGINELDLRLGRTKTFHIVPETEMAGIETILTVVRVRRLHAGHEYHR